MLATLLVIAPAAVAYAAIRWWVAVLLAGVTS